MGERTDQIEQHIKRQRNELEDNFSELERKVRDAFDWRTQFHERPGTMLGVALVAGAIVGAILPSGSIKSSRVKSRLRSSSERPDSYANDELDQTAASPSSAWNAYTKSPRKENNATSEVWENLKIAAIGMATARISDTIEGLAPGFSEHYKKAASDNKTRSGRAAWPYSVPAPSASPSKTEGQQKPNGGTDYSSHS